MASATTTHSIKSRIVSHFIVEQVYSDALSGSTHSKDNINDINGFGYTALMLAVERENLQVLRALLEAGADLNVRKPKKGRYTALSLGVDKGHTTAVRELLKHGAFLSCKKGIEALDMARENGFLYAVVKGEDYLIERNKEQTLNENTGVFQSFKHDRVDLVKELTREGSYVSLMHLSTYTFLHKNKLLLHQLINDGIDVNIVCNGKTALTYVLVINKYVNQTELHSKDHLNDNSASAESGYMSHSDELTRSSEEKFDMNTLHKAIKFDYYAITDKTLAELLANINDEARLHLTVTKVEEIVKELIEAGANVNKTNNQLESPLMLAIEHKTIVEILIKAGADVNLANGNGMTPLHLAAVGQEDIFKMLIEAGGDVNKKTNMGETPLMLARNKDIFNKKSEKDVLDPFTCMKYRLTLLKQYTENQIEQFTIHHKRHLAEDVLKAAYDIRRRHHRLNRQQIEELDTLVEYCIDALNACVYYHSISFDADYGPAYLVLRSGLQFMIEDFESLEFEYYNEDSDFAVNVITFTENLENWRKRYGHSDFFNYITHSAEELRRPDGIPADHTWWFEIDIY